MQIVTILGSPRKAGNTSHVLAWIEQAMQSKGQDVERVNLIDYRIGPCRECMQCRRDNRDLCANHSDDADAILQKLSRADAVLIASPVFCWGFPSHLKALLDRMFCLSDDYVSNPDYATRLQGKTMGLLLTCGGPEEGNAELTIKAFDNLVQFMKARSAGHLLYPFVRTTADFTPRDQQLAAEFAHKLIAPK
jgi:multimeric flavodoxin WrbA